MRDLLLDSMMNTFAKPPGVEKIGEPILQAEDRIYISHPPFSDFFTSLNKVLHLGHLTTLDNEERLGIWRKELDDIMNAQGFWVGFKFNFEP